MESLWIIIAIVFAIAFFFSMFGQGGGSIYTPVLYLFGYAVLVSVSTSHSIKLSKPIGTLKKDKKTEMW